MATLNSSSVFVAANNHFQHPIEGSTPQKSITVHTVVKPQLTNLVLKAAQILPAAQVAKKDELSQELIITLQKAINALDDKYGVPFSSKLSTTSYQRLKTLSPLHTQLTAEGKIAVEKTTAIFQELALDYTLQSAQKHAHIASNLLYNHLFGGAILQQEKVDALYDEVVLKSTISITQRSDDDCNNPSFLITCATTKKPVALLKRPRSSYEASHQRLIENFPLYHSNTREVIGYETDALLGFDSTPVTLRVLCETQEGSVKDTTEPNEAVIQALIPNVTVFSSTITQKDGGALLKSIDTSHCQIAAIAGIIKGLAAGHIGNYIMGEDPATKKLIDIFEFDHKECMVPFNKMPLVYKVRRYGDQGTVYCEDLEKKAALLDEEFKKLDQEKAPTDASKELKDKKVLERKELIERIKTERASIQMGRLSIMGLPQNNEPLQRATLLILAHPSLQILLEGHHASMQKNNYEIQQCALTAQKERVTRLRELAEIELAKATVTMTPRDMYFDIYGGRALFEMATKKYYPSIVIFNNIVGSSYRTEFKDLSLPDTMLGRSKDKPSQNPEAARNFQVLYTK